MDRETYDRLVTDISNSYLNKDLEATHFAVNAVNNVLIAEGIEIPEPPILPGISQKLECGEPGGYWYIYDRNQCVGLGKYKCVARIDTDVPPDMREAYAKVMAASTELVEEAVKLIEDVDSHCSGSSRTIPLRKACRKAGAKI